MVLQKKKKKNQKVTKKPQKNKHFLSVCLILHINFIFFQASNCPYKGKKHIYLLERILFQAMS